MDIGLGSMAGKTVHLTADDKPNYMRLRDIAKDLKVREPNCYHVISVS